MHGAPCVQETRVRPPSDESGMHDHKEVKSNRPKDTAIYEEKADAALRDELTKIGPIAIIQNLMRAVNAHQLKVL